MFLLLLLDLAFLIFYDLMTMTMRTVQCPLVYNLHKATRNYDWKSVPCLSMKLRMTGNALPEHGQCAYGIAARRVFSQEELG